LCLDDLRGQGTFHHKTRMNMIPLGTTCLLLGLAVCTKLSNWCREQFCLPIFTDNGLINCCGSNDPVDVKGGTRGDVWMALGYQALGKYY
jgi:hypothetical protein